MRLKFSQTGMLTIMISVLLMLPASTVLAVGDEPGGNLSLDHPDLLLVDGDRV